MPKGRSIQLARARRNKVLVKFTRPFEKGSVIGYVLDIGPQFFLLGLVSDDIRFNGFQCFRLEDVRNLRVPAKHTAFVEAALKKRGEKIVRKPDVRVSSLRKLLLSANNAFPLVTIHRERADPDVCHIGRVIGLQTDRVSLREIGPDAVWDAGPTHYSLREITRVDFGSRYEEALHMVGGDPPETGD